MNCVIQVGNMTRDPELRYTQNGKAVCSGGIAINEFHGGEKKTEFFNFVAWGKTAETMAKYATKGVMVSLRGSLHNKEYEKDGQVRKSVEINVHEMKLLGRREPTEADRQHESASAREPAYSSSGGFDNNFADDIPF